MILAEHQVLRPPGDVGAESRNPRKTGSGEGLVKVAVGKAVAAYQAGLIRQGMIEADIEPVVAVAQDRRGDIVLSGHGPVGQRIEVGDRLADGVDSFRRNPAVLERALRERVQRRSGSALRKISGPLECGGNIGDLSDSFPHPAALVVAEEKRAVLSHRPAEREPELVPLVPGRSVFGMRKEIARVQRRVAKELVGRAVQAGWCPTSTPRSPGRRRCVRRRRRRCW